jgi:autotransporter adhesin
MYNSSMPVENPLEPIKYASAENRTSAEFKSANPQSTGAVERKVRRAAHLRGLISCAALAFTSLAGSQAVAQTSVVGACTGVSLPRSVVTDLIGSVLVPVLTPAQTLLSPLTGGLLNLNITPTLTSTAAGAPITLNALDINGNAITAAAPGQCVQQADGFQLTTPAGLSLGGGRITGLGSGATYASAAELDAIAFGNGANTAVGATGAVAIGTGARVTAGAPGSVALGQNSVATGATLGNGAYLTGGAATAEVNIGSRRLTGLAGGSADTDAVNVAQLKQATLGLTPIDTLVFDTAANAFSATHGGVATRITNVADGTIAAGSTDVVNGGQLATTNAAVTANTTTITNVGAAVTGLQADALLYNPAINAFDATRGSAPGTITNVAAGALNAVSTDAVNGGQLFATNTRVDANAADITNLTTNIANGTADPLAVRYADATKGTLVLGSANGTVVTNVAPGAVTSTSTDAVNGAQLSATNDAVAANAANITTLGGSVSTLTTNVAALQTDALQYDGGLQAFNAARGGAAQRITNIAAGTLSATSSDAVSGAQVYGLGSSVAAALGGTSSYNPATGQVNVGITYAGTTYGDVQGAISAIETSVGGSAGTPTMYFHANSTMADSQAMGTDSTAIGPASMAGADGALAAGRNTKAMSAGSVAIGDGAAAMTGKAVSIGSANIASGDGAVSIGDPNIATGNGAVALGRDNQATGVGAVALGDTNFATGDSSVSIGGNNNAVGAGAVTIGNVNAVNGANSLAIGTGNTLNGLQAIAIGNNNRLAGDQALGFGNNIVAIGVDTLAVGNDTIASGDSAAAYGNRAAATGIGSTALGTASTAGAQFAVAVGNNAAATAVASTALGTGAVASSLGSVAIGTGAIAATENSVALGGAASASRGGVIGYTAFGVAPPQTSLGEVAVGVTLVYTNPLTGLPTATGTRQITGVSAGSDDTDAVNVAQLRGVSNTLGTAYAAGLGGGATYNAATGAVTGPAYVINGTTYNNVGDALAGVSGAVGQVANTAVSYDTAAKDRVTLGGAAGTTITNVAAGAVTATSTDAINGAQLAATNQTVANVAASTAASLGGGSVANADGSISAPTYQVATVAAGGAPAAATYNDVGTALTGLGNSIANVNNRIDTINTVSDRAVTYDGATGTPRDTITLAGANGTRLTNVAAGAVNATSTDAVNGAQLNAVGQQVATNTTAITNLQNGTAGMFQVNNAAAGPAPVASGTNAVAGGSGAVSSGVATVALGNGATATGANSVALGAGSIADRENSVSVGSAAANRQITNVAAGVSTSDAVNVGQLNSGLNQTLTQANAYTDARLNQVNFDLKKVRRDANGGTAAAMALATIPQAYGPGMGMIGGGISTWGGESAFAVGVSKANADGTFVLKVAATMNTRGKGGGAVGAGFAF